MSVTKKNVEKIFLIGIDTPIQFILFQHLTDVIFTNRVENHFKIQYLEPESIDVPTSNGSNAMHYMYIAGYVYRHLRSYLEKENHELKEEMILCLMDFTKGKTEGDTVSEDKDCE